MNQQIRLLLAIALSMGIMVLWQVFFSPPLPETPEISEEVSDSATPSGSEAAPERVGERGNERGIGELREGDAENELPEEEPEELVEVLSDVRTQDWVAQFSSRGGGISSFELLGEKQRDRASESGEREQVNLVRVLPSQPWPLSTSLADHPEFGPHQLYRVAEVSENSITYVRSKGGITLSKRYFWEPEGYLLKLEVEIQTPPGNPEELTLSTLVTGFEPPEESPGFFTSLFNRRAEGQLGVCHIEGSRSVESLASAKVGLKNPSGRAGFAGVDRKYFLAAVAPSGGDATSICSLEVPKAGELTAKLSRQVSVTRAGSGATLFDIYLGPKDMATLTAAGHGLERSVNFGFFAVVSRLLLAILKIFQSILGNWGLSIIALTVLVKGATFPLTHKQMISMEAMRKLAPKMEEIKTKFAGDQQKINTETMKLYRENNVNPMGGCLPMLIQMPVWFALYTTLSTSFDLYNQAFIPGWIDDLTARDPYFITPVLMVVTMFLTQLLTPQPQANQQMKVMMYTMPIIFGFIMLSLPAGLVLYIFTNNLLSIGQSLWFRRKFGSPVVAAAK